MNKIKEYGLISYYGILHLLTIITSIIFVANTTGMNMPLAFLVSGIGTLIFTLITKGKTPLALGLSGSYVAGVIAVSTTQGVEFAVGGTLLAGVFYILFAILIKYFPKILNLFTPTILSLAILFIAFNLLPIGVNVVKLAPITGLITFVSVLLFSQIKRTKQFSFPLGLLIGSIVHAFLYGLSPSLSSSTIEFIRPQFSMLGFTSISIVAIAVLFEALSDSKLVSDVTDTEFKPHRIIMGNGLATVIGALFGSSNAVTTYTESTSFLMETKWFKWQSTVLTSILLIVLALIPQVSVLISYIPIASFGGLLLYLFSTVATYRISELDLSNNKTFLLGVTGLGLFYVTPALSNSISPIAVAMLGLVMVNYIYDKIVV